jgi:hypothetical protein
MMGTVDEMARCQRYISNDSSNIFNVKSLCTLNFCEKPAGWNSVVG